MIHFRKFQERIFKDRTSGIVVLHWGRQLGKSFTLAAWAVDRLILHPGRLVTVLSNSKENGAEFVLKCAEVCRMTGREMECVQSSTGPSPSPSIPLPVEGRGKQGNGAFDGVRGGSLGTASPTIALPAEDFRTEVRIRCYGHTGRIKVLAANPRTARGFSGDLILDEFAFHEDSVAIWEAVEPILASNPDFQCRIASTGNGRHNMFYRMVSGRGAAVPGRRDVEGFAGVRNPSDNGVSGITAPEDGRTPGKSGSAEAGAPNEVGAAVPADRGEDGNPSESGVSVGGAVGHRALPGDDGEFYTSAAGFTVSRVTRTAAYGMGVPIFGLKGKRESVTPEFARAQAMDKRAYDQNYECVFGDESMTLLTHELITAAQSDAVTIDSQAWSEASLDRMRRCVGRLEVGNDIGRNHDLSMVTVLERDGAVRRVVGMLRMENMRLPDQQKQLFKVCNLPKFHAYCGDMTGLGLGLVEFLQDQYGSYKIRGVNFGSTEPVSGRIKLEGRKQETARVTEIMAVNLLACFEDRTIKDLPNDAALFDDLRKPEKITSPGGRVSIAATRDGAGHADGFWSLALAVRAGEGSGGEFAYEHVDLPNRFFRWPRRKGIIA